MDDQEPKLSRWQEADRTLILGLQADGFADKLKLFGHDMRAEWGARARELDSKIDQFQRDGEHRAGAADRDQAVLRQDVDSLRQQLGELKTKVETMKWQLFGLLAAVVLAGLVTGIAVQQMTVATFQAALQSKPSEQPVQPASTPPEPTTPRASAP